MTIDIYWRIGMEGDHASLRTPRRYNRGHANGYGPGNIAPAIRGGRLDDYGYIDHMAAVARASESAGFLGGLLPSFPVTDDPWAVSAALARETTTYRFMVAFQPGFLHPVQAARMSASLQRATGGRLVYNIISGGGGPAQLWWGDKVAHDDRYARTSEFLDVLRGVWDGEPYDHDGRFFTTHGAALPPGLAGHPFPEVYFSGSSGAAVAAATATPTTTCPGWNRSTICAPSSTACAPMPTNWAGHRNSLSVSTSWPGTPRKPPGPRSNRAGPSSTVAPPNARPGATRSVRPASRGGCPRPSPDTAISRCRRTCGAGSA